MEDLPDLYPAILSHKMGLVLPLFILLNIKHGPEDVMARSSLFWTSKVTL